MKATIAVLSGDGIGPEVTGKAVEALQKIASKFGHDFSFTEGLMGGIAIDQTGNPLPDETIAICETSDAILLGAVGGPKWSDPTSSVRPEQGLLKIRKHFVWLSRFVIICQKLNDCIFLIRFYRFH